MPCCRRSKPLRFVPRRRLSSTVRENIRPLFERIPHSYDSICPTRRRNQPSRLLWSLLTERGSSISGRCRHSPRRDQGLGKVEKRCSRPLLRKSTYKNTSILQI